MFPRRGRTLTTETNRTLPEEGAQIVSPHDSKLKFKNERKPVFHFAISGKKILASYTACLFVCLILY